MDMFLDRLARDHEDDSFWDAGAVAILLSVAADDARQATRRRRNLHRLYLCRPQLLPNPRWNTPWQRLYHTRYDRAFITTMGIDVATFDYILASGFEHLWNTTPIPRNDANALGRPRTGARSLDAAGALGLYLHYLSSTMRETSLQEIFALIPSTVARYIHFAEEILYATLRMMPEAEVAWPEKLEHFQRYTDAIQTRHPLLVGAFGSIDGVRLPGQVAYGDPEMENATYNGWLHGHHVSCVLAFAPDGTVMTAQLNAPGSWHDSRVARRIYEKLRDRTPDNFYLVADTAFPRGPQQISERIKAPLKDGDRVRRTALGDVLAFNRQLLSYRQTAEWGMRGLQGSFGRLRLPLDINEDEQRMHLLEMCTRMNNVRARLVGISQIRDVYMPIWRETDGYGVWEDLGSMLISEIRVSDRVSRFHLIASD